MLKLEFSTSP